MAEKPMLGGCCVCLDERGWAENPLVYCDGQSCNVAVHQACYGIVKVPSGPWFCRKCESQERAAKVKCELCPHRDGALKRTDGGGWAHVVCALYIPEVTFGSVSSMEPITLLKVPPERFNKTCYICEEESRSSKASMGACMTCAKQGCKGSFHVTCAQMNGLLCEEASGGHQTKYCGYCKAHLAKVKKTSSFKSLSCTKVYKLPMTSSSDELASPERVQLLHPEPNLMKPGDIRYTKAGKKRSKSLEESLAISHPDSKSPTPTQTIPPSSTNVPTSSTSKQNLSPVSAKNDTLSILESSPVPIVPVQKLFVPPGTATVHSEETQNKSAPPIKDMPPRMSEPGQSSPSPGVSKQDQPTKPKPKPSADSSGKSSGLTLSSLAEAASALSQSSGDAMEEKTPAPSTEKTDNLLPDNVQKKAKSSSKESGPKKKKDSKKSSKSKSKKDSTGKSKKRERKPHSNINPHKPVPPSRTKTSPSDSGVANFPRHGVVSLANMGMDSTETYGPHEIGDNNKIIKPDMSVDGVTALERLLEEQKRDTMEFFREYGTTPDVAALMQTLHKVREENSQLQSAIEQMSRRRDQLLLIKTRVSGLRTDSITSGTTSTPTQHSNAPQQQSQAMIPPVQDGTTFSAMTPQSIPSIQPGHPQAYAVQQVMSYPDVHMYNTVTTK